MSSLGTTMEMFGAATGIDTQTTSPAVRVAGLHGSHNNDTGHWVVLGFSTTMEMFGAAAGIDTQTKSPAVSVAGLHALKS